MTNQKSNDTVDGAVWRSMRDAVEKDVDWIVDDVVWWVVNEDVNINWTTFDAVCWFVNEAVSKPQGSDSSQCLQDFLSDVEAMSEV